MARPLKGFLTEVDAIDTLTTVARRLAITDALTPSARRQAITLVRQAIGVVNAGNPSATAEDLLTLGGDA